MNMTDNMRWGREDGTVYSEEKGRERGRQRLNDGTTEEMRRESE